MEMMRETIDVLKRQTSQTELNMQAQLKLGTMGGAAPRKAKVDDRPLKDEEKVALNASISELPPEKTNRIVEIIKERMSNFDDNQSQEIEIDLDRLDAPTLRHLQRYVKVNQLHHLPNLFSIFSLHHIRHLIFYLSSFFQVVCGEEEEEGRA